MESYGKTIQKVFLRKVVIKFLSNLEQNQDNKGAEVFKSNESHTKDPHNSGEIENSLNKSHKRPRSSIRANLIKKSHFAPKTFRDKKNPMLSLSNFNIIEPFKQPIDICYKIINGVENSRPQTLYLEHDISN